jgi:spermidine/putrescine transport system ATP-binding protein
LDLKLRKEMQHELKKIQQEVGITFIYVTHDQEEALTMSDTIVVMNQGEIQQIGTPTDIYNEPENRFVADFIGESNLIEGIMLDDYRVHFDDQEFECIDTGLGQNVDVDIVLRPEDIDIVPVELGKIRGIVKSSLIQGRALRDRGGNAVSRIHHSHHGQRRHRLGSGSCISSLKTFTSCIRWGIRP